MNNTTDVIYSNIRVYYNEELIFVCGSKKAKWYIKNDLAFEKDGSLYLKFEPKGRNSSNIIRDNICVSCGVGYDLTRHHVVPYCYRRHYGVKHDSFDILSLCINCHSKYEAEAMKLKNILQIRYNERAYMYESVEMKSIALRLLNMNLKKIDRVKLILELKLISKKKNISKRFIEYLSKMDINPDSKHLMFGFTVANSIRYETMVDMWRRHFLTNVKCDYLPLDYIDVVKSLA